jgi:hypothetical protein
MPCKLRGNQRCPGTATVGMWRRCTASVGPLSDVFLLVRLSGDSCQATFSRPMKGHDTSSPRMFLVPSSAIIVHISPYAPPNLDVYMRGVPGEQRLLKPVRGVAEAACMALHFR